MAARFAEKKRKCVEHLEYATAEMYVSGQTLQTIHKESMAYHLSRYCRHRIGQFIASGDFSCVYETQMFEEKLAVKVMATLHDFLIEHKWFEWLDKNRLRSTKDGRHALFLDALGFGLIKSPSGLHYYAVMPRADGTLKSLRANFEKKMVPVESLRVIVDGGSSILWAKEKGKAQGDPHHGNLFRLNQPYWSLGDGSLFCDFNDEIHHAQIKKLVLSVIRIVIIHEKDAEERAEAHQILGEPARKDSTDVVAARLSELLGLNVEEATMLVKLYRIEISLETAVEKAEAFLKARGDARPPPRRGMAACDLWSTIFKRMAETKDSIDVSYEVKNPEAPADPDENPAADDHRAEHRGIAPADHVVSIEEEEDAEETEEKSDEEDAAESATEFSWPDEFDETKGEVSWQSFIDNLDEQKIADLRLFSGTLFQATDAMVPAGERPENVPAIVELPIIAVPCGNFARNDRPSSWPACVARIGELGWLHLFGGKEITRTTRIAKLKVVKALLNAIVSIISPRPYRAATTHCEPPLPGAEKIVHIRAANSRSSVFNVKLTTTAKQLLRRLSDLPDDEA